MTLLESCIQGSTWLPQPPPISTVPPQLQRQLHGATLPAIHNTTLLRPQQQQVCFDALAYSLDNEGESFASAAATAAATYPGAGPAIDMSPFSGKSIDGD